MINPTISSNYYPKTEKKLFNLVNVPIKDEVTKIKPTSSDKNLLSKSAKNLGSLPNINLMPFDSVFAYSGKDKIFPNSWYSSNINVSAKRVSNDYENKGIVQVEKALAKYPNHTLDSLSKVYLVGELSFFNSKFSGTNSKDKVYIVSNEKNEVEKTFHHEFSSILLRNNPDKINISHWKDISKSKNITSQEAVQAGQSSLKFYPKLLERGFLCEYARSNTENDFNMYAENLFAGGKEFWEAVDKYPKVRAKTDLIIHFYNKIDPAFTEGYFKALVK